MSGTDGKILIDVERVFHRSDKPHDDGSPNRFRIFWAKPVDGSDRFKAFADLPARMTGREPTGRMLLRIKKSRTNNGIIEKRCVILDPDPDPPAPERARPAGRTETPSTGRPDPGTPPVRGATVHRVRPTTIIGDGPRFKVIITTDVDTGEEMKITGDFRPLDAMRERTVWVTPGPPDKKGKPQFRLGKAIPEPDEVSTAPAAKSPPASREPAAAEHPPLPAPKGVEKGGKVTWMRIRGIGTPDVAETRKRVDGSTAPFMIFDAIRLDSPNQDRIKVYAAIPDGIIHREMTLPLERDKSAWERYRISRNFIPDWVNRMDFEKEPIQKKRVRGVRVITGPHALDDGRNAFILDVEDEKGEQFNMQVDLPGTDPKIWMTVMVRPHKPYNGDVQYRAVYVEPDPGKNTTPEQLCTLIEKADPPGLGKKLIPEIVAKFGTESLHVIRNDPERLRSVPGIGKGTIEELVKNAKNATPLLLAAEMVRYEMSPRLFTPILETFRESAPQVVRDEPYQLTQAKGVTFKDADLLAVRGQKRSEYAPERILASIEAVMDNMIKKREKSGDLRTSVRKNALGLIRKAAGGNQEKLGKLIDRRIDAESELRMKGKFFLRHDKKGEDSEIVYFTSVVAAEKKIALSFLDRKERGPAWRSFAPDVFLENYEAAQGFPLDASQRQAVHMATRNGTFIMTGGPGVGKTTTLKATIGAMEKAGINVVCTAPTGIASRRMSEATGHDAMTIHSALAKIVRADEEEPLLSSEEPNCLIIDEASMVDVLVMSRLLHNLPKNVSVMLVGDADQLPSIGPGEILADLIRSNALPLAQLNKVHRQSSESDLLDAFAAIRRGEVPRSGRDMRIINAPDQETIAEEVINQCVNVASAAGLDPKRDLLVLAPVKAGLAGVNELNKALQERLNPKRNDAGRLKNEIPIRRPPDNEREDPFDEVFRVGDRVMHTRNDPDRSLVNGEIGEIVGVFKDIRSLEVKFRDDDDAADDKETIIFTEEDLPHVKLAYAMTIHKSQGSEAPMVVVPLPEDSIGMMNRNLIYTATTRAKSTCVMIGRPETIETAINQTLETNQSMKRRSTMARIVGVEMKKRAEMTPEIAEPEPEPDPDPSP